MSIYEKLLVIQQKLVAPKGQFNSFGKYKYRSCEDILEALKPLLKETKTVLFIKDDIEAIGDRVYVKSTATIHDAESDGVISVTASAREEESKKGMDSSQVTGATSSYARKYALNGLFCIDDTKDADTESYANQSKMEKDVAKAETDAIDDIRVKTLLDMIAKDNINSDKLFKLYKVKDLASVNNKQFTNMVQNWEKIKEKCPGTEADGSVVLFGGK